MPSASGVRPASEMGKIVESAGLDKNENAQLNALRKKSIKDQKNK
tara:strand:- start:112 stop:246 length:135 start_codon:yes stop_codon:yes gene_type:complete